MDTAAARPAVDVVVLGAGISGLAAARALVDAGLGVRVVDKARGVGGRMATRRRGEATFDHGAQFFTTRSEEFTRLVEAAVIDGAAREWTRGFDDVPDGYPRWCGVGAMTSLCKWMAAGLDVVTGETVTDLAEHPANAYVLTAPVPQSLAVLSFSRLLPPPELAIGLTAVSYRPTLAVMATYAGSTDLPAHGGRQVPDDPAVTFIADNMAKGVSAVPALTLHLSESWSHELWSARDDEIVARSWNAASAHIGSATVVEASVQRWRYAGPVQMWPERTVAWGADPVVALAGEAFDGPKVEGAFLSGLAAAAEVVRRLGHDESGKRAHPA